MIRFIYTPNFQEFWVLNRTMALKQIGILKWFAGILLVSYAFLPWMPNFNHEGKTLFEIYTGALMVLILPGLLVFIMLITYWTAKKRWNLSSELRCKKEYEIGPDGIQIRGDGLNGFLDWKHFTKAECIKGLFVITTTQGAIHYFPESIVPDCAALRVLLRQHISGAKL